MTQLTDDVILRVAPSIFAEGAHVSRSERYRYIATINVLNKLREQGFYPFMVGQNSVRKVGKREYTKHILRLRHASQITHTEANEIILINSHDGSSSYQMLAGMFRFVCHNGLVCGTTIDDIRVPHKGDVVGHVVDGAFTVLENFALANAQRDAMKATILNSEEQHVLARAALVLKYDENKAPIPITERQLLFPKRQEDRSSDLWTVFNCIQENLMQGGLMSRSASGRRSRTRAIQGIDQHVKMNRALWALAEGMQGLKS